MRPLRESRKAGYSRGIKQAGYTCAEAKQAGYVEGPKQAGYTCAEAKQAGYTCAEAKRAGYTPWDCADGGYSFEDGKAQGYKLNEYCWTCGKQERYTSYAQRIRPPREVGFPSKRLVTYQLLVTPQRFEPPIFPSPPPRGARMPPAAHTPASERARRVPRSARERTANRRAGWGHERSTAIARTGRWREPRDAFDPKIGTTSARARSGA